VEIASRIRAEFPDRHIHLTTEDNRNITKLHERDAANRVPLYTAEWNDDFHNAAHVLATGETDGYYEDFAEEPWRKLARALAEGFVYQGEISPHAGGKPRGQPSAHLPPTAFIDFLQNHDQVGNRAFGERLSSLAPAELLRNLYAVLLLSPHIPLLFMGEEWGETRPFCFFTDFHGELADKVREGRREEFAKFAVFADGEKRDGIPDPNAGTTFESSKIDWERRNTGSGRAWLVYTARLLDLRRQHIVPLLQASTGHAGRLVRADKGVIAVDWTLPGALLQLRANFSDQEYPVPPTSGDLVFAGSESAGDTFTRRDLLPAHSVVWAIERPERGSRRS
jgi:maltooligosyltrehalose trehalohydrolase